MSIDKFIISRFQTKLNDTGQKLKFQFLNAANVTFYKTKTIDWGKMRLTPRISFN